MPVQMDYLHQGHIVRYVISDPWTIDEFTATFESSKAYLDNAKHTVHWLVHLDGVAKDPAGVLRTRQHPAFSHANTGFVIFCVNNSLARRIIETTLRLARFNRTKFFKTYDEGLAFLDEQLNGSGKEV